MAAAIISGLTTTLFANTKQNIHVSEPYAPNRAKIAALGVRTTDSNATAAHQADVLVLAVKPQVAKAVCQELAQGGSNAVPPLVVSIAAGVTVASLEAWLGGSGATKVVRVMPNTPALLGEGASGVYAGAEVGEGERAVVTALMESVSRVVEWVDREDLLDVVTGLSGTCFFFKKPLLELVCFSCVGANPKKQTGSGPAYFFAFVEHLVTSATALGLSEEQATRLAKQTCLGAGKMLVEADADTPPAQLRKNVTSPNGTTEAALKSFQASGFAEIVDRAVKAATDRGAELGKTLGEQ